MSSARLHIKICNASNLRAMDANGKSDPYCAIYLKSDKKHQLKTSVKNNDLSPVWDEEFDLVCEHPESDVLKVVMFDQDPLSDDRMIDPVKIPVQEVIGCLPNEYVFDKDVVKTDKKDDDQVKESGHFRFTVQAILEGQEPPAEEREAHVDEEEKKKSSSSSSSSSSHKGKCVFDWGTYGSTYSTDFSGYTSGDFESLGSLTPPEKTIHHHEAPTFKDDEVKPRHSHVVKGKLVKLTDLIKADDDGTDAYVTLQLFGKSAIEKGKGKKLETEVVHDTSNPEYNFEFEFNEKVRKGDSIELKVIQKHKILNDVCIGFCRIPIKDIDNDDEKDYKLLRPKDFSIKGDFTDFGKAYLVLHHEEGDFAEPQ